MGTLSLVGYKHWLITAPIFSKLHFQLNYYASYLNLSSQLNLLNNNTSSLFAQIYVVPLFQQNTIYLLKKKMSQKKHKKKKLFLKNSVLLTSILKGI